MYCALSTGNTLTAATVWPSLENSGSACLCFSSFRNTSPHNPTHEGGVACAECYRGRPWIIQSLVAERLPSTHEDSLDSSWNASDRTSHLSKTTWTGQRHLGVEPPCAALNYLPAEIRVPPLFHFLKWICAHGLGESRGKKISIVPSFTFRMRLH